ncbi:MAG: EAL domain-containing protein [Pseudomonadota bacterium]
MTHSQPTQPVILIADDDPTTRLIAREVLEQAGMHVLEARDGEQALDLYLANAPDAVLLDVDMPQMDGLTVCEKIRATETRRTTPVCIVTGLDDFSSAGKAFDIGATDFITKPIDWSVLAFRVRYLLRSSNALNDIRGLVSAIPDVLFVLNEHGAVLSGPAGVDEVVSVGIDGLRDVAFSELFEGEVRARAISKIAEAFKTSEPQILEHEYADAGVFLETRFVARDRKSVLAMVRDITQRKQSESQIYDLAYFDRLTGLPNRHLFSQELERILDSASSDQRKFAMLLVDLDRFKRINDTLGHSIGDELLKAVARRLDNCTRASDDLMKMGDQAYDQFRLARLGGDEFVIVMHDVSSKEVATSIANRIVATLSEPFSCKGHHLVVTPSIGVAFYPKDGHTKDDLVMNADSAMYRAKSAGRNTHCFYSGSNRQRSLHRLSLEEELRKAIKNDDFELHYQPKLDLASWSIVGAEALVRWRHHDRGWISPGEFIPIAEETGLILSLGNWVLEEACRQLRAWRHSPLSNLAVSINVSGPQLYTGDLVASVAETLARAGVDPVNLELEITESMLMQDVEKVIETLQRIKQLGVGLSVDDFGTGYSSLAYLKRFPIDALKIDASFVQDLRIDEDDAAICAAIIAMAHKLNLQVVAEGVECETQVDYLREHRCEQVQGFLFSKAIPPNEFEALVHRHQLSGHTLSTG